MVVRESIRIALAAHDSQSALVALNTLLESYPRDADVWFLKGLADVDAKRADDARRSLDRLHELGALPARIRALEEAIRQLVGGPRKPKAAAAPSASASESLSIDDQPATQTEDTPEVVREMLSMIGWFLLLVGGWLGGLAALTLAGWGLSRSVCATIKASARDISVPEHLLRAAHAIVMRIAAWVYYLSMPLAALAVTIPFVVMLAGEIIHGHLSLHHMEAFGTLVIFTWVMTLWALTAGANSVGALPRGTAFEVLKLDDHPKLRALLNDVAVSTGARPVDEVLLHTDARIEAFSLGGLAKHLVGSPGRLVVVIGLGLIDAVTVGELRVLIAIELARLHDRSVAGGAYSLQLRGALSRAISSLLSSPASRWNFGYQFLRAFRWAFGLVSDGAARWQQRAADDRAIESFGPALFCKAIAHTPDATNGRTQRARAMGLLRAKSKPSDDEPASSLLENRAAIERAIAPFSRAAADDGHDEASNKPSKPSLTDPW